MNQTNFAKKLKQLKEQHRRLLTRKNRPQKSGNGIFDRYENPVLTAEHTPLTWRYDFDRVSNPHLMTRLGVNSVFNVGAMEFGGKIVLMARVEGWDRKSFFAVAESKNGVDNFQFWDYPVRMPELEAAETRTAGFTGFFAPNATMTKSRATSPPPLRAVALRVRRTCSNGSAWPI